MTEILARFQLDVVVPPILSLGMLAMGYFIGWAHGVSNYSRAAPMFMAGTSVMALFVLGLVGVTWVKGGGSNGDD